MRTFVLVLALGLTAAGCKKKPSPEYAEAERRHQSLVLRDGDDAYGSLDMDAVVDLLRRVPPDALEAEKAQRLLSLIDEGQKRVRAERAEAIVKPAPPEDFGRLDEEAPREPRDDAPIAVEGPPPAGMAEDAFVTRYAGCVSGPKDVVIDVPPGKAPAYAVKETPECQKKLFVSGSVQFFFLEKKLAGRVVTRTEGTARSPAPPTPPAEPETEERFLVVPGAPLPKELQGRVPPPNTGAMPAAKTGEGLGDSTPPSTLPARTN